MKFDKEHRDIIIKCLEDGLTRKDACKAAKISNMTLIRWMSDEKNVNFVNDIKKAELIGQDVIRSEAIAAIRDKFDKQWQAAAWWLERRFPNEFGVKQEIRHEGSEPITVNVIRSKKDE